MTTETNSLEEAAAAQFTDVIATAVEYTSKRAVNVSQLTLRSPEGKEFQLKLTLVAEPVIFDGTMYPEEITFTTSVIEQLRLYEEDNSNGPVQ